jgi:Spy/CpxP family protein refolding chaperone
MSIDLSSITASTSSSSPDTTLSFRPYANLDLTEDQRTQIRSIYKNAKSQNLSQSQIQSQIDSVLTSSQLATLKSDQAAQSSGSGSQSGGNPFTDPNGPFANLDLSSSQQSQIQQIISSGQQNGESLSQINAQISAVLTPTQQATFTADLQNLPQPGGSQSSSSTSSSSAGTSNSGIDLTGTQQQQIEQLLQNAESSGTSISDTLSQVFSLLTSTQKAALSNLSQNG